ncbi:STAS domain-containing protein [Azospirillum sp. ST 5-10]|uniref:STAS domain-containing protein n=1 Tax=unclassified Azospirillum TaxID=2630922 RepID=UPI003F4A3363
MALEHTIARSGTSLTVRLSGNFTFAENGTFRRVVEEVTAAAPSDVAVDLSGLRTVDSAGLSMLVLLRERLQRSGATMALHRPPPQIDRILAVVDFGALFAIVR